MIHNLEKKTIIYNKAFNINSKQRVIKVSWKLYMEPFLLK